MNLERRAEYKSEYYCGQMFAMASVCRSHVLIVMNVACDLSQQLKGKPCEVYASDMRLCVTPTGLYTCPDVVVACGEIQFADDQEDTLLNPVLIGEVLSESTRDYDRGRKFQHYLSLPALREYLTVSQDESHIEHWSRQDPERWWLEQFTGRDQTIHLASIGCTLRLAEVYERIDWTA